MQAEGESLHTYARAMTMLKLSKVKSPSMLAAPLECWSDFVTVDALKLS